MEMDQLVITGLLLSLLAPTILGADDGTTRRGEIVVLAAKMAEYKWSPSDANVAVGTCGNSADTIYIPGRQYMGIPYVTGGWDGILGDTGGKFINRFADRLSEGKAVISRPFGGEAKCATGIDCSAFVMICWGYKQFKDIRRNVAGLAQVAITTRLDDLHSGDAIGLFSNNKLSHAVLVRDASVNPQNNQHVFTICEAHRHGKRSDCSVVTPSRIKDGIYWDHVGWELRQPTPPANADGQRPKIPSDQPKESVLSKSEPIKSTPTELRLGFLEVGTTVESSIVLENVSDSESVNQVSSIPAFVTIIGIDASHLIRLAPRSKVRLEVVAHPTGAGELSGSLQIIDKQHQSTVSIPINARAGIHCLTFSEGAPVSFGTINRKRLKAVESIILQNCGTERVDIHSAEITSYKTWQINVMRELPFTLNPGEQAKILLSVTGASEGEFSGRLSFRSNAVTTVSRGLKAGFAFDAGVLSTPVTALGSVPCLSRPSPVQIREARSGDTERRVLLQLSACGFLPVRNIVVHVVGRNSAYEVSTFPSQLDVGGVGEVVAVLHPHELGDQGAELSISADDVAEFSVPLNARIVPCIEVEPRVLNYGTGRISRRVIRKQLSVRNCGTTEVPLSASITRMDRTWSLGGKPSEEFAVSPGRSINLDVWYRRLRPTNETSEVTLLYTPTKWTSSVLVQGSAERNSLFVRFLRLLRLRS